MLFRRGKGGGGGDLGLPTTSSAAPTAFHFSSSSRNADGSGKAIMMEAPLAKDWKKQSGYTKGTYYCLLGFILLIFIGYKWLRYEHASVWLTCHAQECTLDLTPRGNRGSTSVQFPRRQLVKAEAIKVEKNGKFVSASPALNDFRDIPPKPGKGKYGKSTSGRKTSYKGPDLDGHYPSYRITIRNGRKSELNEENEEVVDTDEVMNESDLSIIKPLTVFDEDGDFAVILRQFKVHQSRRRVSTVVKKIESYIKNRRQRLVIKENSAPCWQGIVCMVVGLMGFLLSLLLGQFWDGEDYMSKARQSGPGVRRQQQQQARRSINSQNSRSKRY